MLEEFDWGWGIVVHLFLVGLSAGALLTSAFLLLRDREGGAYFSIARLGAFLAPLPVIIDGFVLITELGSFQAGHWFRFLNLFKTITWSPMSIGSWVISALVGVSLVYAATFLPRDAAPADRWHALRRALAWIGASLALAAALYPGFMLGILQSRPFWHSPVLPLLFTVSALAMGIAAITLIGVLAHRKSSDREAEHRYQDGNYLLTMTNVVVLAGELLLIGVFIVFAMKTIGSAQHAILLILGGALTLEFWLWAVVIGVLVPIALSLVWGAPRLTGREERVIPPAIAVAVPATVLFGAFMLRYVVVVAGQMTGPVGV